MPLHGIGGKVEKIIFTENTVQLIGNSLDYTYRIPPRFSTDGSSGCIEEVEKAEKIAAMLEELYPETPVPLDHENTFQLLIAVLMSAQTTDLKVNQVTPALFSKAPTAKEMAKLDVETILEDIRQVGLAPTKAKIFSNYHKF